MAGSGFFALFDDIVTVLDDVAAMSKVAAGKTVGIAGDDLAVGAEQVVGVDPKRELPVILAVAKGSLKNKAFLIPGALALGVAAPWAITPLLMAGGAFLCYEGLEKILHVKKDKHAGNDKELLAAAHKGADALKNFEKQKIKKAIRTDAILSAEIIAITLGAVAASPFIIKAAVLGVVGLGMTAAIYGTVAGIVKLDDLGLHMMKAQGNGLAAKCQRGLGKGLVKAAAPIMKTLSVVGTAAMFIVGGGIVAHGIPAIGHAIEGIAHAVSSAPFVQGAIHMLGSTLLGGALGAAVLGTVKAVRKPAAIIAAAFAKLGTHVKTKIAALRKKAARNPAPVVVRDVIDAAPALKDAPDLSADMNKAAQKPAEIETLPQKKTGGKPQP